MDDTIPGPIIAAGYLRARSRNRHDLTDEDKAILAEVLRETIERDASLSARTRSLQQILAKLLPQKPPGERSTMARTGRR
jgi:hypothetical protein